jgi:flagellar hook-basal body complex protein FliE
MADFYVKGIDSNTDLKNINKTPSLKKSEEKGFDRIINEALAKVSQVQKDMEKAVNELATGGDITSAILAIEKADMTFQLMVEIRNKLISTYEEVMRMQI